MAEERENFDSANQSIEPTALIEWEFELKPKHERGKIWYVSAALIGLGLLIYALISANFLFALIILMFVLVAFVGAVYRSAPARFAITEDGIEVGNAFYPYRDIAKYWFIYQPPTIRNLYIDFRNNWRPRLRINMVDKNPNHVRDLLSRYVHEDVSEVEEPLTDWLERKLKL